MKTVLLILCILVLTQLAFVSLFQEEPPPFELPKVFEAALLGFITFWIVEGLKKLYPPLAGPAVQIAAGVTAAVLVLFTGLVNAVVPPNLYFLATDLFIWLTTLLVSFGTKRVEQSFHKALAARSL